MSTFYYVPQYFTTQLSVAGGIDDSQTTGIVLQSISGVDETLPGIIAFSWSNPIDTTKVEYITYTSINATTKELQGVTRGQEGYSAKSHLNGATVAWPLSKSHINNIPDSTTTFTNKDLTSETNTFPSDGWTPVKTAVPTYASANTVNVPSGAASIYQIGDRYKFTQHGVVKYAVILAVADTLLTFLVNTDYVVENTATYPITLPYYSHQLNPVGYPHWFNIIAPSWSNGLDNGSGGAPTTTKHKVKIDGNTITGYIIGSGVKVGTTWFIGYTPNYGVLPETNQVVGSANVYWAGNNHFPVLFYESPIFYFTGESTITVADNTALSMSAIFTFRF